MAQAALRLEAEARPKLSEAEMHNFWFNVSAMSGVVVGVLGYWAWFEANAWLLAHSAMRMVGG